jgi:hypothetical protein
MTDTQRTDAIRMHGDGIATREIARRLAIPRSSAQDAIKGAREGGGKAAATPKPKPQPACTRNGGRSLAEFRAVYDKDFIIPRKIKAALAALGASWEYEVQFAKLAGVSLADLGNYRDQFADNVVTLRESRRAWAGTTATAKAMREML